MTDTKNQDQGPESLVDVDEVLAVEESVEPAAPADPSPAAPRPPAVPRVATRPPAPPTTPPRPPAPRASPSSSTIPRVSPSSSTIPRVSPSSSTIPRVPPPASSIPRAPAPPVPAPPRGGRLHTPATGRPAVGTRPPSLRPPPVAMPSAVSTGPAIPPLAEVDLSDIEIESVPPRASSVATVLSDPPPPPSATRSEAPEVDLSEIELTSIPPSPATPATTTRDAFEPPEPVDPASFHPPAPPPLPAAPPPPVEPETSLSNPHEPDAHAPVDAAISQPVPLSIELPELTSRVGSIAPPRIVSPPPEALSLGTLDGDDLDAAFRSLELDEKNDPSFVARLSAPPALAVDPPDELLANLTVVRTHEVPLSLHEALGFDALTPPGTRASLPEDLELHLGAPDPSSIVPELLRSMQGEAPTPATPVPDLAEETLDAAPAEVKVAPFRLDIEPPVSDAPAALITSDLDAEGSATAAQLLDFEPLAPADEAPATSLDDEAPATSLDEAPEMSLDEAPDMELDVDDGPALVSTISEGPSVIEVDGDEGGAETELLVEGGEEIEVETPEADRGAILAASVTSRNLAGDDTEHLYALDPRAEALARAAMLVDESAHAQPPRAAAMLTLAADLYDGVAGDRELARRHAAAAFALAPTYAPAIRLLRRIEIAAGNATAALALCDAELATPLGDEERATLLTLAGELAARVDDARAQSIWRELASLGGVGGAVAQMLAAGHSRSAMGDALGAFATATGGVLAASVDVARARMMEGEEAQAAMQAIRDAVARDPSDASAWLAMARIGLAQSNGGYFREAVTGLAQAALGTTSSVVATALRRALDGVLGDAVAGDAVADGGVAGWLAAHAVRDAGGDPSAQVSTGRSLAAAAAGLRAWTAWGDDDTTDAGRFLALRRAAASRDESQVATRAAAFVGGAQAGAIEAGLRAKTGSVGGAESAALGASAHGGITHAALVAATEGIEASDVLRSAHGDTVWHEIARIERSVRAGEGERPETRAAALTTSEERGAAAWARRAQAGFGGDEAAVLDGLRAEASTSGDPRRAATFALLAGAWAKALGAVGGDVDAAKAADGLAGDLAAAELAALHASRGEAVAANGADLLDAASMMGDGAAQRMAAVQSALRRAALDPSAAAEQVWKAWSRDPSDASLGALVLRAAGQNPERAVAVARAMAESAWSAGREHPEGVLGAGTFLALSLERASRFADASQALARSRTFALQDRALAATEERIWLRAGMHAEAIERAFDRLNTAGTDAERVAAYERLAEIDRAHRQQVASAVLSLQEILTLAPGHLASLHPLLRFFLEQGRHGEALDVITRLVEHAGDPSNALAFAHLGARLASSLADGDPAAAAPFHAAAQARGLVDLRLLHGLEADARRAGDHTRFADVMERLADFTAEAATRSVYLARAAQSAEATGDHGRALGLHVRAVDALPMSVLARWGAAWSMLRAGEAPNAAEMFEAAGNHAASPEAGAWSWMQAANLWRDTLSERTRALAAFREVLERDPSNRAAFDAALQILRDAGDSTGELELLEKYGRASVPADAPQDQARMHTRAAELAESQGDLARAIAQWRTVLAVTPDDLASLRALARLGRAAGEWNIAADALIRLAKQTPDTAERIESLFNLGAVLEENLDDAKRAELAWRRVLALAPRDARTLQRLMELYRRSGDVAREADALQSLVALAPPGPERIEGLLRLASLAELSLNDVKRAHAALEAARRDSPGDLKVLRALRQFHMRNGDPETFVAIADRATADVRRAADLNPRDLPMLERLSEMLEVRGHDDASRIAAAVAVSLGSRNDRARALSFDGTVKGLGAAALTPEALALLAPPSVSVALREVLGRAAEVIEQVLPIDPRALSAEKLGARPHPFRDEIARRAEELGLPAVEIYITARVPTVCAPIGRCPPAVLVPTAAELTPASRFAIARAMLLLALSLTVPVRIAGRELALALGAVLRQFEPMYRPDGVDARELVELSARITRAMPRALHTEIAPFADVVLRTGIKDAETIRAGALELGDRVALLATGSVSGGIALLSPANTAPIDAVESVPAVGRLVRVALSDRFMEARRLAGADRPTT